MSTPPAPMPDDTRPSASISLRYLNLIGRQKVFTGSYGGHCVTTDRIVSVASPTALCDVQTGGPRDYAKLTSEMLTAAAESSDGQPLDIPMLLPVTLGDGPCPNSSCGEGRTACGHCGSDIECNACSGTGTLQRWLGISNPWTHERGPFVRLGDRWLICEFVARFLSNHGIRAVHVVRVFASSATIYARNDRDEQFLAIVNARTNTQGRAIVTFDDLLRFDHSQKGQSNATH